MNQFLKKINNIHSFLISFLVILFFLSTNINSRNPVPYRIPDFDNEFVTKEIDFINSFLFSLKEFSLFGFAEVSILISIILIILFNRKALVFKYNKFSYYLKITLFSLLTFEELSYLTENKFEFLSSFNNQSELNLHNSNFLNIYILDYFPIVGKVGLITFILTISLFMIGYGSYFKILKNIRFIFLEKKYSFYSNLYFLNLVLSNALIYFSLTDYYGPIFQVNPGYIFNLELIEFFIYSIFLIDILDKIRLTKNINTK